ncbi:unnamed protein product [Lupinus luteus]|uniref:Uncharacterized protein n=1 Tax=Lupinus luteus TaxID=3873 RepID=A0AAV1W6K1_LUPLU
MGKVISFVVDKGDSNIVPLMADREEQAMEERLEVTEVEKNGVGKNNERIGTLPENERENSLEEHSKVQRGEVKEGLNMDESWVDENKN